MVRAPYFDKNGVRKGAWSAEEDDKLRTYIHKFGINNWRELPRLAGLQRCGKSCRLRWMNYLRPDVKLGSYTEEEDDLIIKLHEEYGSKWSKIAVSLPGRTDNEIKNHWHTHLKKRAKAHEADLQSDVTNSSSSSSSESEAQTAAFQPILQSSPLSPKEASPGDFPPNNISSCDSATGTDYGGGGNCLGSTLEMCQEYASVGDFWTEPFVGDNYVYNQSYQCSSSFEGGCWPPYASHSEDDLDLVWQVMNELPNH